MSAQNKYPIAGPAIVIFIFLLLVRACIGCDDNSGQNKDSKQESGVRVDTNKVPNSVDTTSPEYVIKKLSNKKSLSKLEKKQLKEAREDIADMEAEKIAEERWAAAKNLKENFEKQCLSAWDGSCRGLVKYVKDNMNDPGSFEHVETRYSIQGDCAVLVMKYRGKNAFGGVVTNYVKAKVNSNCEVMEILETE